MEAALIAFVPSALMLGLFVGSVAVYMVMTQRQTLAFARGARIEPRYRFRSGIEDGKVHLAVLPDMQDGWRIVIVEKNPSSGLRTATLIHYVAV